MEKNELELHDCIRVRREFMQITVTDNIMVIVLKGHMLIERQLDRIIECYLLRTDLLKDDWSFSAKASFARATGLVSDDTYRAISKLNWIRNQYAHNLNYDLDDKEFEDFISVLCKRDKRLFEKSMTNRDQPVDVADKIRLLIANMLVSLAIQFHSINEHISTIMESLKLKILEKDSVLQQELSVYLRDRGFDL